MTADNDARGRFVRWTAIFRASQWWEFKFGPILAVVYGTALQADRSLFTIWPTLVGIFLALLCVGVWANVLNDWTDISDDVQAGKSNQIAGKPLGFPAAIVAGAGLAGWIAAGSLNPGRAALILYACNGLAFLCYSIPPVRLKRRAAWGILADAVGAHTLPALFAVVSLSSVISVPLHPVWLLFVGLWSFACGLRGILWHQLLDYEHDRRLGGFTFVCHVGPRTAQRLAAGIVFPLEILTLAGLLWWCATPLPLLFLALDGLLVWLRRVHYRENLVVVVTRERYRIVLHEFSDTLLPFSLLIASTVTHPWDIVILGAHAFLFPVRLVDWTRDLVSLTYKELKQLARNIYRG